MSGTVSLQTITSANSVFTLTIPGVYAAGVQLQGYSADAAFETESTPVSENVIGVDGIMASGWLPRMTPQSIMLMASSTSMSVFEQWNAAEIAAREKYPALGLITLPTLGVKYLLTNGALTDYVAIPAARKVLQSRTFKIVWQQIVSASI